MHAKKFEELVNKAKTEAIKLLAEALLADVQPQEPQARLPELPELAKEAPEPVGTGLDEFDRVIEPAGVKERQYIRIMNAAGSTATVPQEQENAFLLAMNRNPPGSLFLFEGHHIVAWCYSTDTTWTHIK